jgi:hypothetical protein
VAPDIPPTLSICCLTNDRLDQVATAFDSFSPVATEIICAVDATVPVEELRHLDGHVDKLVRCEVDPASGVGRNLAWLYAQCNSDWIFRMDGDEVPSSELLGRLPAMLANDHVDHYGIPCLWNFPDPGHVLDEAYWIDNYLFRLSRNRRGLLNFTGVVHSGIEVERPYRLSDAGFYHLALLLDDEEARTAKAARYEAARPGVTWPDGRSVNSSYLPERFSKLPPAVVPEADLVRISHYLDPRSSPSPKASANRRWRVAGADLSVTTLDDVDRVQRRRFLDDKAYRARIDWLGDRTKIGIHKEFPVRVHNDGTFRWECRAATPVIHLSYHWRSIADPGFEIDGVRTTLTADVAPGTALLQFMTIEAPEAPGDYLLELDLVHEGVRWFYTSTSVAASLTSRTVPGSAGVAEPDDASASVNPEPNGGPWTSGVSHGLRRFAQEVVGRALGNRPSG